MLRIARYISVFGFLALSGCAASSLESTPAIEADLIYARWSGPFCGRCEGPTIMIGEGHAQLELGYWAGDYRNRTVKRRNLDVSSEQIARFRALLDPYRPEGLQLYGDVGCADFISDAGQIRVTWRDAGGEDVLVFDRGCRDDTPLRRDLAAAAQVFGLPELK